ncbi:hypothetical protein ACH8I4_17905, partial [Acinetobacter sp. ABJ_C3_5]|uniref:hypothetical protein n=1 Tax=Acinetobacter courvalinii TaxID=280147 RepID=UPI0037CA6DE2
IIKVDANTCGFITLLIGSKRLGTITRKMTVIQNTKKGLRLFKSQKAKAEASNKEKKLNA